VPPYLQSFICDMGLVQVGTCVCRLIIKRVVTRGHLMWIWLISCEYDSHVNMFTWESYSHEVSHIHMRWVIFTWDESCSHEMSHVHMRWVIFTWDDTLSCVTWEFVLMRLFVTWDWFSVDSFMCDIGRESWYWWYEYGTYGANMVRMVRIWYV